MQSLGFKQSHFLTDVRLALGFSACLIAGVTFYYDYQLGFEKTKHNTLYAVVAYFIINSILTLWIWGVEGSCVYIGSKDGVKVRSHTQCSAGRRGLGREASIALRPGPRAHESTRHNMLTWEPGRPVYIHRKIQARIHARGQDHEGKLGGGGKGQELVHRVV